MATRSFHKPLVIGPGRVIVWCTFRPAAGGAPTDVVGKGIKSVTRTAAGLFDVALQDSYMELEGHEVSLMQNAASKLVGELKTEDVASTSAPKVTVRTKDANAGTDADIAANANNRVSLTLYLRNTSVT